MPSAHGIHGHAQDAQGPGAVVGRESALLPGGQSLTRSRQVLRKGSGEQLQPMPQGEKPVLAPSLEILDAHISAHPEQLQPITMDLVARLDDLVGSIDVDLNAPLEPDDEEDEDRVTL